MKTLKSVEAAFLTSDELDKMVLFEAVRREIEKRETKNLQFARRLKKAKINLCCLILLFSAVLYVVFEYCVTSNTLN